MEPSLGRCLIAACSDVLHCGGGGARTRHCRSLCFALFRCAPSSRGSSLLTRRRALARLPGTSSSLTMSWRGRLSARIMELRFVYCDTGKSSTGVRCVLRLGTTVQRGSVRERALRCAALALRAPFAACSRPHALRCPSPPPSRSPTASFSRATTVTCGCSTRTCPC